MSRCPCVARTGVKSVSNLYVRKFIRISCGNTICAHDKNEVNEYKKSVIDDQFSRDCQTYDDNCVDCIAYCNDNLLAIEVTNEEGLKRHIETYNRKCKIKKRICLNDINKTVDVLILYGISDPSSIRYSLNCSNIIYKHINNLQELCNALCSMYQIKDNNVLIIVFLSFT
ncbi:hypothetical protein ATG_05790 [Desulfurococcaceae archaeon AG1]|nr:hypothetical protein ATG_05790 [Desulfurococcaceae archaeon AG1]